VNEINVLRDRRAFMTYLSSLGLGSTLFPGVLWAKVSEAQQRVDVAGPSPHAEVTKELIAAAEGLAGVSFTDAQREMMVEGLKQQVSSIETLHKQAIDNSVAPAIAFNPLPPGFTMPKAVPGPTVRERVAVRSAPANLEDLAFATVSELSTLVRARKITSMQLTEMYLQRLERYDPTLHAVVTLTPERARERARAADEEIARGRYRGPLHGIPWGAKDLLAARGYKTTWGAGPYKDQVIDRDATVVRRLDDAGAVLVAKLTLGELAQGDRWFGGMTRNPWKTDQGSSGSSAGPGSATAAGLVGFSIGSETLGSISSPSTRNGVTGLRPTFGRVPRTGAMALSWSMDKLGPMCRSVEDCALVFAAIHGPDSEDLSCIQAPFTWNATAPLSSIRVGYVKSAFDQPERDPSDSTRVQHATKRFDDDALAVMRKLGVNLIPVEIPDLPYGPMRIALTAEAAAAFDDLTRSGRDQLLANQQRNDWPTTFRVARFIPAVDYVNANRLRSIALREWHELFKRVDVIVAPTFGPQLTATNLTGHPAVILPSGFRDDGTPVSVTFLGGLFDEARLLRVAHAYQRATDFHLKHPSLAG
jgi:Asp-tRNA(Asn)/Glu-tRNA(Gln) amidotransferase A subunit family amidase